MATEPSRSPLRIVRIILWVMVAVAVVAAALLALSHREPAAAPQPPVQAAQARIGGPFTLVGADGRPFSSQRLEGKPYLIYFGFTRCGDVCPMTLGRLVRLREQARAKDSIPIVFVTIDPAHDGPREVGQYSELFGAPIIGLTGSQDQIDAIKSRYGIHAQPMPHAAAGQEMQHTSTVLLFDRQGNLQSTIAQGEDDAAALAKIRRAVG